MPRDRILQNLALSVANAWSTAVLGILLRLVVSGVNRQGLRVPHPPCHTGRFLYTNNASTDAVLTRASDRRGAIPTVMSMADVLVGHNGFLWNEKVKAVSTDAPSGVFPKSTR